MTTTAAPQYDTAALLKELDAEKIASAKKAAALIRKQAGLLVEGETHLKVAMAELAAKSNENMFQQNQMLHAAVARLTDERNAAMKTHDASMKMLAELQPSPVDAPPMTPLDAFHVLAERQGCIADVRETASNVTGATTAYWDGLKTKTQAFVYALDLAAQRLAARPLPTPDAKS